MVRYQDYLFNPDLRSALNGYTYFSIYLKENNDLKGV